MDSKEIKPVNPKENQNKIINKIKNVQSMGLTAADTILGKADALNFSVLMELYLTVTLLWPPDVKS